MYNFLCIFMINIGSCLFFIVIFIGSIVNNNNKNNDDIQTNIIVDQQFDAG